MIGRPYGAWLFFSVLALAVISVTVRLNLVFTAQVNPSMLRVQRARVFPAVTALDIALAVLMIAGAARLAWVEASDETAGLCLTLGIVTIVSVTMIEPATTRAARLDP